MHLCVTKTEAPRIAGLEIRDGRQLTGYWRPCTIWLNAWYFYRISFNIPYFTISVTPITKFDSHLLFRHI